MSGRESRSHRLLNRREHNFLLEQLYGRCADDAAPGTLEKLLNECRTEGEGLLALCAYMSSLVDTRENGETECERQRAAALLETLLPAMCPPATAYDGHIEPRAAIPLTDDYGARVFRQEVRITLELAQGYPVLVEAAKVVQGMLETRESTQAAKNSANAPAGEDKVRQGMHTPTLCATVSAWLWLKQAVAAARGLAEAGNNLSNEDQAFYKRKIATARCFLEEASP